MRGATTDSRPSELWRATHNKFYRNMDSSYIMPATTCMRLVTLHVSRSRQHMQPDCTGSDNARPGQTS